MIAVHFKDHSAKVVASQPQHQQCFFADTVHACLQGYKDTPFSEPSVDSA
jgi:hypothetical protein